MVEKMKKEKGQMNKVFRYFGIDVGSVRIGLAVSDALGITAQGIETYVRTGDIERDAKRISEIASNYAPCRLVFGLPRNMDGSYGEACENVKAFAEEVLKNWDGEHDFHDERLTTVIAEKALYEAEMNWKKRRKVVDKMAAQLILQGYLELHPIQNQL